ncbi:MULTISPECIES: PP2C family protein-serine/threonine phosphatase [Aeromonas]|uniref:PP2C family protein-serine/threonine phosphatase n=1 Tax=Aeromonas TaxID=642 RepID=UPI0011192BE2|nr:protein phosphatase 2C domain-containing protein [Aeromonas sobria]TNH97284.1 hypothetical protein CF137_05235 [Aeromonas sobria]
MKMIEWTASSFSEAGRKKENQDSLLVKKISENTIVLAIADGMGGKPGGEIASQVATETVAIALEENPNIDMPAIFKKVKKAMINRSAQSISIKDMGSTLTVAVISGNEVAVGHVGDCRLYHLRGNGINTKTKDQTEVQKLLDDGILTRQRALSYHRKNILLSVLNANKDYELQEVFFSLQHDDRIMMLTDGAYSLVKKSELRDISVSSSNLDEMTRKIKVLIESKEIKDDYTLIAFQASFQE